MPVLLEAGADPRIGEGDSGAKNGVLQRTLQSCGSEPGASSRAKPCAGNEQGELPEHVATTPVIKELIKGWDVARTDQLVASWEAAQAQRKCVLSRSSH